VLTTSKLALNKRYTVSVSNVSDVSGNKITASSSIAFTHIRAWNALTDTIEAELFDGGKYNRIEHGAVVMNGTHRDEANAQWLVFKNVDFGDRGSNMMSIISKKDKGTVGIPVYLDSLWKVTNQVWHENLEPVCRFKPAHESLYTDTRRTEHLITGLHDVYVCMNAVTKAWIGFRLDKLFFSRVDKPNYTATDYDTVLEGEEQAPVLAAPAGSLKQMHVIASRNRFAISQPNSGYYRIAVFNALGKIIDRRSGRGDIQYCLQLPLNATILFARITTPHGTTVHKVLMAR
jgi:hypothetical protein